MIDIGMVLCTFPYEMVSVTDGRYDDFKTPGMRHGTEIPRYLVDPLEKQVFQSAQRQCDNKTAAVFFSRPAYRERVYSDDTAEEIARKEAEKTRYGSLMVAGFWDSNAKIVEFDTNQVVKTDDPESLQRYVFWTRTTVPSVPANVMRNRKVVLAAIRYALQHACTINVNSYDLIRQGFSFTKPGEQDPCAILLSFDENTDEPVFMSQDRLDADNLLRKQRREQCDREYEAKYGTSRRPGR